METVKAENMPAKFVKHYHDVYDNECMLTELWKC